MEMTLLLEVSVVTRVSSCRCLEQIKKARPFKGRGLVPRGTTFVAVAGWCGDLSMTLGNGRLPTALICLACLDSRLCGNDGCLVSAQLLQGDFAG